MKVDSEQKFINGQWKWVKNEHYEAMVSRFFICKVEEINGVNQLVLKSVSTRGTQEDLQKRMNMFLAFQQKFNESLAQYQQMK